MSQSTKQIASLKNQLQIPLIIRDYLITDKTPDPTNNYALHEIMSNFLPCDALLSTAFTMKEIANSQSIISNDLQFLHIECDRIIEKYASHHDIAEKSSKLGADTERNMTKIMLKDIEELLDIIELCQISFEIINPKISKIINIFNVQLQAHLIIIDEVLYIQEKTISKPYLKNYKNNVAIYC